MSAQLNTAERPAIAAARRGLLGPLTAITTPLEHVAALWPGFAEGRPFGNKSLLVDRYASQAPHIREQLVRRTTVKGTTLTGHEGARRDELLFVRSNTTLDEREADIKAITLHLQGLKGQSDKFISVNTFFGRRTHDNLKALTACIVDLDLGKALEQGRDYRGDFMHMRQDALDAILAAGIPEPNLAVHSGKGVHLYWLFDRIVPAAAFTRWQACVKALIELLRPVGADPAVKDSTRVLRLVGTINSSAPGHCRTVTAQVLRSQRHSFDFLADQILPVPRIELQAQRKVRQALLIELGPEQARRRALAAAKLQTASAGAKPKRAGRRYSSTAIDRLGDLTLLAKTLYPEGIEEGKRDQYLFAVTVHLAWLCRAETLQEEMLRWKRDHIPTMTDEEALATMGTVLRRAQKAYEDAKAGIFKSVYADDRYVLSAATLWEQFATDIKRSGLAPQMRSIVSHDTRQERKKAEARAKSKDHYTGLGIRESNREKALQAHQLFAQRMSIRSIAIALKVAPKTVSSWLAIDPAGLALQPPAPAFEAYPPPSPAPSSYPQPGAKLRVLPESSLNNGETSRANEPPSLMGPAWSPKKTSADRQRGEGRNKTSSETAPQRIEVEGPKPLRSFDAARGSSPIQLTLLSSHLADDHAKPTDQGQCTQRRKVWKHDEASVTELRMLDAKVMLDRLGLFWKEDRSYTSRQSQQSERVHVTLDSGLVLELVFTGPMWFDKTQSKGGFGSIDLAMHLKGWGLRESLRHLLE